MTQSDPMAPPPAPSTLVSASPRTSPSAIAGIRYGMSLVAVLLGAYLLLDGNWGSFAGLSRAGQPDIVFLLVTQLLFGAIVLLFGVLVAPAAAARRAIAAVIVVVLVLLYAVLQPLYLLGTVQIPVRGLLIGSVLGAPFLVTLAASAAWLIIRARPGLSYLLLIATIIIPIAVNAAVLAALPSTTTTVVSNVLATIVGVGIAWAARAIAGRRSAPIG
jgi:hypothetical protein